MSSGEAREILILLGPLERSNLNQFPKHWVLYFFRILDDGQSPKNPGYSESYTPSSKPFGTYGNELLGSKKSLGCP
jgi:hypothetical protein